MHIEKTHHVDASEPDAGGMLEYHYEYDLFRFADGPLAFVARSYVDKPAAVRFLRVEEGAVQRSLLPTDCGCALFLAAVAWLRSVGFARIEYLGASGYRPVE